MAEIEETVAAADQTCERCDQESRHVIKFIGDDNQPHYVCWTCLQREEKRNNLSGSWKRSGRVARPAAKL